MVRVRPDVAAVARLFDYTIPVAWHTDGRAAQVQVGSRVRIQMQGRRVGGWVMAVGVEPPVGVTLRDLSTLSGIGPNEETIELARWVAQMWVAPLSKVLRTASPARNVHRLPALAHASRPLQERVPDWAIAAFTGRGAVVRIPPAGDRWPIVLAALASGNPLFVAPSIAVADVLAKRLQSLDVTTALLPDHWARARAGAAVVGTRTAVLGPVHDAGSVVVLDEHDEALAEERSPTWHAREVAVERARRLGIPCVLTSPAPSVEALGHLPLIALPRAVEHAGWAAVEAVDRRDEPPGRVSLFSSRLVTEIRSARRVGCVLNRRGRARLLACGSCGDLAICENCQALVRQDDHALVCSRCETERPVVCASCGATRLKNIRMGVTRAREELSVLANETVSEVSASGWDGDPDARIAVGTEALLHRAQRWDTVIFLDFDQELLALRQNASSQALGLLARASRSVGPRAAGGRVIVQTREPDHLVIQAAQRADPSVVSDAEAELRQRMGWPPHGAQAVLSGDAAAEFVTRLGQPLGITVNGPAEDRWLVRAVDQKRLAAALSEVERPDGRLRIEVNPDRL